MRKTYKIAVAELASLFYSPIAWFILIIFAFQTGMHFSTQLGEVLQSQLTGPGTMGVTARLFSGQLGLFTSVQEYLYLYTPLLTMGLMSREYANGSINLLYSSPVRSHQIILGKFLAMAIYGLLLLAILCTYLLVAVFTVENIDIPPVLTGLLGLYLLICAYSAIGLFMSSLTSYQVVAALGTLVMLAALSYMNKLWQDMEFVREITYWLSISGRANEFVIGLICSEDVLYFVIVAGMFLALSTLKVHDHQSVMPIAGRLGRYGAVVLTGLALGFLSSRPSLMVYHDATREKSNTLTPNSQEIVAKLDGGLTVTTFVNLLDREYVHGIPKNVKADMERLRQYVRFKPETKLKYVYYYDTPSNNSWVENRFKGMTLHETAQEVAKLRDLDYDLFMSPDKLREKHVDLTEEGNMFVRLIERENGAHTFLRIYDDFMKFPSEAEITAAFKRLVMKLPRIGFLSGHGEPTIDGDRVRDYSRFTAAKQFRYSLLNQGCEVESLNLSDGTSIPEDMDVIVIAEMQKPLSAGEKEKLDDYIARGGNLLILMDAGSVVMQDFIGQFGIGTLPGRLVQPKEDIATNLVFSRPTAEAAALNEYFESILYRRAFVAMERATGLVQLEDKGFDVTPILRTDSIKLYASPDTVPTWNEMETIDFINDTAQVNPAIGEQTGRHTTALALHRQVGETEQRIFIFGDAGFLSNGGLYPVARSWPTSNFSVVPAMIHWLSEGSVPVDVSRPRPIDNQLNLTREGHRNIRRILMGLVPVLILAIGTITLIRRRGG